MGGKTEIVQPTPPAQPSVGESAREYAAALPDILKAQLEFQPQFDRAQLESFRELGPEFAQVSRDVLEQYSPTLAGLDENLAQQALDQSTQGLTQPELDLYRNEFTALVGNQANSGIGADFISRNLVRENLAARQAGQNLGLSLQGKVPISQAFQQPSAFQVSQGFAPAYATQSGTFGSVFSGAGRALGYETGSERLSNYIGAAGGAAQGVGSIAASFCWVASEIFGGWDHPKTCASRYYIDKVGPKWFRTFYIKNGESIARYISNKPILKHVLRPIFELFAYIGDQRCQKTQTI